MVDVTDFRLAQNVFIDALLYENVPRWVELPTFGGPRPVMTYFLDNSGGGGAWTANEIYVMNQVFDSLSAVINIDFEQVFTYSAAQLVEYKELGTYFESAATAGHHQNPDAFNVPFSDDQIEGHFNVDHFMLTDGMAIGGSAFYTFLHEIMHGIGLDHPFEYIHLPGVTADRVLGNNNINQYLYSVMSYNSAWGESQSPITSSSEQFGGVLGPSALDIAALQHLYGANTTYRNGQDNYLLPDSNQASFLTGTGFRTIWDTGGIDSITYAGSMNVTIDLRPATLQAGEGAGGFLSRVGGINGGFLIARGVVIEDAFGGSGNDTIRGSRLANRMEGGEGNDTIYASVLPEAGITIDESDTISGGGGDDSIFGGLRNDLLFGNEGADTMRGLAGADRIFGGGGADWVDGGGQLDVIDGDAGNDTIFGGADIDDIRGGADHDLLDGQSSNDLIEGGTGNDTIFGGQGSNRLFGEADNDSIYGGFDAETIGGGAGIDLIVADSGNDYLTGDAGDDSIFADYGEDTAYGGAGNDLLVGGQLNDLLSGGTENDTLDGGFGNDTMLGGAGNDT
jgi:Ca2+-binding RTX toxin-like protein